MVYLIDTRYEEPEIVFFSIKNLLKGSTIINPSRQTAINEIQRSDYSFILSHGLPGKIILGKEYITTDEIEGNKIFALSCFSARTLKNSEAQEWAGFKDEVVLPEDNPYYVARGLFKVSELFRKDKPITKSVIKRLISGMDRTSALLTVYNINRLYSTNGKVFNI